VARVHRPAAGWADAAIVTLAVAALVDLLYAFLPLTSMWAIRDAADRGGDTAGVVLVVSPVAWASLAMLAHLACAGCLAGWWLGTVRGRSSPGGLPRRSSALVRAWWATWLGALAALVVGTVLSASSELARMIAQASDGRTVDVSRATGLLGLQIAGRLPGATLCVAAAVLGMLAVHVVTITLCQVAGSVHDDRTAAAEPG
jgi:hypothetical protein